MPDLFITCPCSQKISVTPADCGGSLRCSCGRMVDVPRLSDVREMSGLEAIDIGIVNKIKQQIAEGALPREQDCVACNCRTSNIILCEIDCEWRGIKREGIWYYIAFILSAPYVFRASLAGSDETTVVHGRDTWVTVPMRACEKCAKAIRRSRRKRTSALMKTDLYRDLFVTYPNASSVIVEPKQAEVVESEPNSNPYSYK